MFNPITRRAAAKSLLTGLTAGSVLSAATKEPLGFQLYTIRKVLPGHAREALQRLAHIGYREIESIRSFNPVVLPLCKEFGIQTVSCHYDTPLVTGNFDAWKSDFPQGRPTDSLGKRR